MLNMKSVGAKWMIAALVGLVAAGSFGVAPASAEEAKYLVVSDTPEGIVQKVMTESELDVVLRCNVDSPTTPTCTNGPLAYTGFFLSHGIALPIASGFSTPAGGVPVHKMQATSILSSATTSRVFRCEINESPAPAPAGTGGATTFQCFAGSGSFPPRGSTIQQDMYSFLTVQGGAADTTALSLYQQTGGEVHLAGLGKVTAQLTHF